MPINVPDNLPAVKILEGENIFIMENSRALRQDIRPIRIAICNLMPHKIVTEVDIIRVLSNSPLQVELEFFYMDKHDSKNTPKEHLDVFYKSFNQIRTHYYDGLIITGAPVEQLAFEEVDYWNDLKDVFEWSSSHVTSTLHICWGAQAGLYYHYGINKYPLKKKLFGVFPHSVVVPKNPLFRGFDDRFFVPHSRYTGNRGADFDNHPDLRAVALSEQAGVNVVVDKKRNRIFVIGHFEYNVDTLKNEYFRDVSKGLAIDLPENYFPENNPDNEPVSTWRANGNLFYLNWLNYYVYQKTPFDFGETLSPDRIL